MKSPLWAATDSDNESDETSAQDVVIAAYEFPPYYSSRMSEHFLGEIVYLLNNMQSEFNFVIREIRPQERYQAISADGCCDLIMFESPTWGWPESGEYEISPPIMHGSERMYSLQSESWEPGPEDRIAGVVGYHYGITNNTMNNVDVAHLMPIYRTDSQSTVLTMVRNHRVKFGLLSDEYVRWLEVNQPERVVGIIPAPEADSVYTTNIILGPASPVDMDTLMVHILRLGQSTYAATLLEAYGLRLVTAEEGGACVAYQHVMANFECTPKKEDIKPRSLRKHQ
ncbi:hypothetical protein FM042_06570 [Aliidiomarina halalkaliphila]|uniref:Amino acid ABC transporter substrate-binding protein n=1 Tax=Aliidiomarina halalkaliphila TaxID=2593535 RepID=A0A552X633_9GAMM|nr:hypothetical protein [Aliidiomarina halalkaliphila]TRW50484.1 hypothetical protein FM042_06570 [Aliidiomarina halalkaliphila]